VTAVRAAITAIMLIAVPLVGGACAQKAVREPAHCVGSRDCWTVQFAFINFTGQRAQLYIDDDLVLDAPLETADWSTALSRSLTHSVAGSTSLKLSIDGAVVYEDRISGPHVRTIYIDARSPSPLRQTDHPVPLLD